jgi:EpsI family protein
MIAAPSPGVLALSARGTAGRNVGLCAVVLIAAIFAHRDALGGMVRLWNVSPMYSYGFTVPLISGYLLWTRRGRLSRLTPKPSWVAGGIALILATVMAATARTGGIQLLDQLAFLVAITGGVLLLFGAAYVKVGWAALAYLLLMVPVWDGFTEPLHAPFQLRSAEIGVWLLQLMGIPAHREGVFIELSSMKVEVARACSGVNYLVAVVALGLPLSYLFLKGIWRRLALLLFAVLVAALSNGLRVALIGALLHFDIGSPLHGPFHVLHGLFVAGIGYVALFAGLRFLATDESDAAARADEVRTHRASLGRSAPLSTVAAGALVALFVGVGLNAFWRAPAAVSLDSELRTFPIRLGQWVSDGDLGTRPPTAALWPGADTAVRRRYRRADGATVDLYIGYFATQRQNKEVINSRAADLHRGARVVRVGGDASGFEANQATPLPDKLNMLFWYHVDRTPEANPHVVRLRTLWNSMRRGRSNGAVVVLTLRDASGVPETVVFEEFAPLVEQALATRMSEAARGI